jgi:Mg-chelatase subunit ChlD
MDTNTVTPTLDQIKAKLSEYDIIIAVDASGSMSETDMAGGQSRWNYVQESALAIIRQVEQLGLVLFGGNVTSQDGVTSEAFKQIFANRSPMGSTPLAEALRASLDLAGKSAKKDLVIVFTDGVPNDKDAAAKVIVDASNALDADEDLTVLFIQVGHDAAATTYLQKLDDSLTGAKFDIVDTKTIEQVEAYSSIPQLLVDAIAD